jgi:nickel-type superoxide dismutase maturation protease
MQEPFSLGGLEVDVSGCLRLSIRLLAAGLLGALVAAIVRVRRVTVDGDSMRPALLPGDRVLVLPTRRPRQGDLVAVHHPWYPGRLLVKRVAAVEDGRDRVIVIGDNRPASTDSRHFGPVSRRSVVGRAVYRYGPPGREGRLPRRRRGTTSAGTTGAPA